MDYGRDLTFGYFPVPDAAQQLTRFAQEVAPQVRANIAQARAHARAA